MAFWLGSQFGKKVLQIGRFPLTPALSLGEGMLPLIKACHVFGWLVAVAGCLVVVGEAG